MCPPCQTRTNSSLIFVWWMVVCPCKRCEFAVASPIAAGFFFNHPLRLPRSLSRQASIRSRRKRGGCKPDWAFPLLTGALSPRRPHTRIETYNLHTTLHTRVDKGQQTNMAASCTDARRRFNFQSCVSAVPSFSTRVLRLARESSRLPRAGQDLQLAPFWWMLGQNHF